MEQHQIYAVLGFLFLLWCSNLVAFSQEAAKYEQQARQQAIQHVICMVHGTIKDNYDVLLWLHRRRARHVTSSLWLAG